MVGKTSLMRGHGKKQQVMGGRATGPKLIIFVMGSISYSEMRCAHQVRICWDLKSNTFTAPFEDCFFASFILWCNRILLDCNSA